MIYCLNPKCPNPVDPMNTTENVFCRNCGASLILGDKYRVTQKLGSGGFGTTYEVEYLGTKKVLKVLNLSLFRDQEKKEKVIALFKREAEALSRLNHPGIPKVETDGYLELRYSRSPELLYCLVMEKIDGVNLQEWLESRNNQPITPELARVWLKQVVEILDQVHAQGFSHRDIKLANIMLRTSQGNNWEPPLLKAEESENKESLVLIDFGAVRDLAQTYFQQDISITGTAIISAGYTPPEQEKGKSVIQSDFFALARSFVHLLTGVHPRNLPETETNKLIWRDRVPRLSNTFASLTNMGNLLNTLTRRSLFDLLDEMMEPIAKNRPQSTKIILQRLNQTLAIPRIAVKTATAVSLILGVSGIAWYLNGVGGCEKNLFTKLRLNDQISCGEEILLTDTNTFENQKGVSKFYNDNYAEAVTWFKKAWEKQPEPETLIYLNNARLQLEKSQNKLLNIYTIAVVAPINENNTDSERYSKEILRGVAQSQDDFNKNNPSLGIRILIVSDSNKPEDAVKIANSLVNKNDIVGIVGHFRSDTSIEAVKIYQKHDLVLISPSATSEDLAKVCQPAHPHCFFRVVLSNNVTAKALAQYLRTANKQRAAIFYNKNSNYSKSLFLEMKKEFSRLGGKIVAEIFLSNKLENNINLPKENKADVIVLFPTSDGKESDLARQVINYAKNNQFFLAGGDSLANEQLLQPIADNQAGSVVVLPWSPGVPLDFDFTQSAEKIWRKPVTSWQTPFSYDATLTLMTALKNLKSPSRLEIKKQIAKPNFEVNGVTGKIRFEKNGNRQQPTVNVVKVERQDKLTGELKYTPLK